MKFKLPKIKHLLLVLFIIVISFGSGLALGQKGFSVNYAKGAKVTISRATPIPDLDFSLFWNVWDLVNNSYFDKSKVVPSKMIYGAIQGMVASLGDPYTMFLPPQENQTINQDLQGNFSGVGIELGYKGTNLAVISPLPASPAEKAGIKPGDLIIGIKDVANKVDISTDGITLNQAVQDIRGVAGTKVTLTIIREGSEKPIIVDLIRETINVPSVKLEYVGDNKDIAHLSILKFGGDTLDEWQKKVEEIKAKGNTKEVILDLRNNPGGYLQDAIDIAGDFLPANSVVVLQETGDGTKTPSRTKAEGAFINSKVVILVNGGSASASEILAGALRDDRKIKLVGDKTFGKGTVQQPEDLSGGAGIHITIAKWLTPNGTWVHGNGLDPDLKVSRDASTTVDSQLDAAIKLLNNN